MKKIMLNSKLIRAFVLVSSLVLSTFTAQANIILTFDDNDIEVGLNESFVVQLFADAQIEADWFSSFSLDTTFNSAILNLDDVTLGTFMGSIADAAFSPNPLDVNPFDSATFLANGENILLASFTFTAINYGTTSLLTISESFTNFLSQNAKIDFDSASANISVVSAEVPEPSTLAIFALGMMGLASRRFKKQSL